MQAYDKYYNEKVLTKIYKDAKDKGDNLEENS